MAGELSRLWTRELGANVCSEEVASTLEQLAAQARAQHDVDVPAELFVPGWVAALRHARTRSPDADLAAVATADVYLIAGVLAGVSGAVQVYQRLCEPDVDRVLRRLLPQSEWPEMRQELDARLLVGDGSRGPALEQYRGSGSVRAWTRAVATRAVIDARRKQARQPEVVQWASARDGVPEVDAELSVAVGEHVAAVRGAMQRAFAQLTVRQRNVIRQSVFHGLSIDELGALYGAHRATAARWLQRARADLSRHLEADFAREVGGSPSDAAGLLRALRSRVDVSVRSFLASSLESEPDER